jgi:Caspase domain
MPEQRAILIAVESYQDPDMPPASHAESDAQALALALEPVGYPRDSQIVLLGAQATGNAIASRLRKLAKTTPAPEAVLVSYTGHGFTADGVAYLACGDTQADDLAETSLPLKTLLSALAATKVPFALLLDLRGGLEAEAFSFAPLEAFFAKHPDCVCLVSGGDGEKGHVSGTLKAGIWASHVLEAFQGRAARALEKGTQLTAAALQAHLEQEVPRTLRSTFRAAPAQTPTLLGNEDFLLADIGPITGQDQPTADPRLQPLRRGTLRSETTTRVKALGGYRKFHRLPDRVDARARKFVGDLAAGDVKADVDAMYAAIREVMGYKRRDVEGSSDQSTGFVRTPDFEYSISIDLGDTDPTTVIWRREVGNIREPAVVLGKPFQQVFGPVFDTLVFEFTRPFDLETWVDRIEDEVPKGVKLRCASDCSTCDIMVAGFSGIVRLLRDRVEVQGQQTPGSKSLVEAFLNFQDLFSGRRDLEQLPLLNEKG